MRRNDEVGPDDARRLRRRAALPRPGHAGGRRRLRRHGARLRRAGAAARRLPGAPGDRGGVRRDRRAARPSCCTARPARCSTTAPACCRAAAARSPRPATTRSRSSRTRCRPSSRSPAAPRPASSWRCGTATLPVEGVQFHPESVLTEGGHLLLANWLAACGDAGARRPASPALAAGGPPRQRGRPPDGRAVSGLSVRVSGGRRRGGRRASAGRRRGGASATTMVDASTPSRGVSPAAGRLLRRRCPASALGRSPRCAPTRPRSRRCSRSASASLAVLPSTSGTWPAAGDARRRPCCPRDRRRPRPGRPEHRARRAGPTALRGACRARGRLRVERAGAPRRATARRRRAPSSRPAAPTTSRRRRRPRSTSMAGAGLVDHLALGGVLVGLLVDLADVEAGRRPASCRRLPDGHARPRRAPAPRWPPPPSSCASRSSAASTSTAMHARARAAT